MSDLIIYNHIIDSPIIDILNQLRLESDKYILHDIINKGDNILITCPNHANGNEKHPGCNVYCGNSPTIEYGYTRCFVCGYSVHLWQLVADCLDISENEAKDWLVENFGSLDTYYIPDLPKIDLKPIEEQKIDVSILDTFESFHPYMAFRGLTEDICKRFKIKYDPKTQSIIFPVFDRHNNLKYLTRRSVIKKQFIIDKNADKSNLFLLNEVLKINSDRCIVVESQIDALRLWINGFPAIATLGSNLSEEQMKEINNTPIRFWITAFDNDTAGYHGYTLFKKMIRKDVFLIKGEIPINKKDIGDLTDTEIKTIFGKYFKEEN